MTLLRIVLLSLLSLSAAFAAGLNTPQAAAAPDAKLAAGQGTCNVPFDLAPAETRTYACLTFVNSPAAVWPLLQIKTGNANVIASVVSTSPPPLFGGTFVLFNPTARTQRGTAVVEAF